MTKVKYSRKSKKKQFGGNGNESFTQNNEPLPLSSETNNVPHLQNWNAFTYKN